MSFVLSKNASFAKVIFVPLYTLHTQRNLFQYYRFISYSKSKFLTFPLFNFKPENEILFLNLLHIYPAIFK